MFGSIPTNGMDNSGLPALTACDCSNNQKRFAPVHHRIGQGRVRRLVGEVLLACEKPQEGAAFFSDVVANRAAQHRIARFKRGEYCALGTQSLTLEFRFTFKVRQCPEMVRKHNPDHRNVCTSTESTAGRSRTIGAQLSPESADA